MILYKFSLLFQNITQFCKTLWRVGILKLDIWSLDLWRNFLILFCNHFTLENTVLKNKILHIKRTNLVCRNNKSFLQNRFRGNDAVTERSLPPNFVAWFWLFFKLKLTQTQLLWVFLLQFLHILSRLGLEMKEKMVCTNLCLNLNVTKESRWKQKQNVFVGSIIMITRILILTVPYFVSGFFLAI